MDWLAHMDTYVHAYAHASAVQHQPKFAYHDTDTVTSQYTLGIEY